MAKLKSATTYEEQVEILRNRGIVIEDEDFCAQKLAEINYYRLTAYFLPFKQADNTYVEGTSFQTVYRIYEFDRKLRGILFSAVEEVEVFLRAKLGYYYRKRLISPARISARTTYLPASGRSRYRPVSQCGSF